MTCSDYSEMTIVDHLTCLPLKKAPAILENIRLGWKSLPGTNALAYYEHLKITAVKSFITLAPGVNVIKRFIRH
jgi:hypothetical protein